MHNESNRIFIKLRRRNDNNTTGVEVSISKPRYLSQDRQLININKKYYLVSDNIHIHIYKPYKVCQCNGSIFAKNRLLNLLRGCKNYGNECQLLDQPISVSIFLCMSLEYLNVQSRLHTYITILNHQNCLFFLLQLLKLPVFLFLRSYF